MKGRMNVSRGRGSLPRDVARSTQPTNPMQKNAGNMGQHGIIKTPNAPLMGHRGRGGRGR